MAVTRRSSKIKGCKGKKEDICNIKTDCELDDFIFDKCTECLGVFNYRKISGEIEVIVKKKGKQKKVKLTKQTSLF